MHSPRPRKPRARQPAHGFDFKHNGTELSAWGGPAYILAGVLAVAFTLLLVLLAASRGWWLFL